MKKNIALIFMIIVAVLTVFLQKNAYDNRIALEENRNLEIEDEILTLSSLKDELRLAIDRSDEIYTLLESDKKELIDENETLISNNNALEDKLLSMKYDMIRDDLPRYWHNVWDSIYKSQGMFNDEQVEEINFLLQPVFAHRDRHEVNPLSCFYTSTYEDVRDLDLTNFLRYFPYGTVPEELKEFEELSNLDNWPFDNRTFENLPVPIHKYDKKIVQDTLKMFADININELTGVGSEGVLYLESTEAYYNYTSDFAPGVFRCVGGIVEDGVIKLFGSSNNETSLVFKIVKVNEKYVIKSFNID